MTTLSGVKDFNLAGNVVSTLYYGGGGGGTAFSGTAGSGGSGGGGAGAINNVKVLRAPKVP